MTPDERRREIERTLRELSPDPAIVAWLAEQSPAESMEAIELRRLLSTTMRRGAQP